MTQATFTEFDKVTLNNETKKGQYFNTTTDGRIRIHRMD